jgi:uncharacterized protein YbjT (DUF2867 family)
MSSAPQSQRVLVIGYGTAGSHILRALAAQPDRFRTSMLVKPESIESKKDALSPFRELGIEVLPGDVTADEATLISLLKGVDVLITALNPPLMAAQVPLAKAALTAGVKRFVPTEFGVEIERMGKDSPMGSFAWNKVEARHAIIASGVPYTLIQCSIWTEHLLSPLRILDVASRTAHITGSMDNRISTTTLPDMAALTLIIIDDPSTLNADIHIASQTLTWRELLAAAERATGEKWTASVRTLEETQAWVATHHSDFRSTFELIIALGKGVAWSHEETWNVHHHPEFKTTTVEEFIRAKLAETGKRE